MDELECLRTNSLLLQLLSHYAALAESEREAWHNRLTDLDGVEPAVMTKLHGDLLAFGWIEWTCSPAGKKSSACYRVTNDGVRACRWVAGELTTSQSPVSTSEGTTAKLPRKKREKKPTPELATM